MSLVPNKPANRLAHVIKTYGQSKNAKILSPTIRIALLTMGLDHRVQYYYEHFGPLETMWVMRSGRHGQPHSGQGEAEARLLQWLEEILPAHHPRETMVPWVARELGRLMKAVDRGEARMRDYEDAVSALEKQATAVGMWAEANKINLNKTTLAQALEAVEDFEYVPAGGVPQGHVVDMFPDGFTIQRLMEKHELEAEGDIMQHCVGGEGYCEAVGTEETIVFSLRDKAGNPHATIEWKPDHLGNWEHVGLRPENEGRFVQIRGKQNKMPAEKYRPYIQDFIRTKFFRDPLGLLMVAMPGQVISFADHVLVDVDFGEDWAWDGVPLHQADFSRAQFVRCKWGPSGGSGAVWDTVRTDGTERRFDDAVFEACEMDGTAFEDCSFTGCRFVDTQMDKVVWGSSSFQRAVFSDCALRFCTFTLCDMTETSWTDNTRWKKTSVIQSNLGRARFVDGQWGDVILEKVDLDGVIFEDWDIYEPLRLSMVDLRRVDGDVARALWEADPSNRGRGSVYWPDWLEEREDDEAEVAN